MSSLLYRLAADCVVVLHMAYVAFVIGGLLAVLIGGICRWQWIRNVWFRAIHLAMIGVVVAESWLGIVCPLTTWEKQLRERAGQASYQGDFVANWVHDLLFFDASPFTFTVIYTLFGLAVAATFVFVPPRWKQQGKESRPAIDHRTA